MILVQIGLIGLPLAGKTTFFNLLTGAAHETGLGGAGEVHTGSAEVPDSRVDFLSTLYKPRKTTYARIQFKDIPGARMEDGASRASKLLDEARGADVLVQVVRAFRSEEMDALAGESAPFRDLDNLRSELLLADMDAIEKRILRIKDAPKVKKDSQEQLELLERVLGILEEERPVSEASLKEGERQLLAGQQFLSEKPLIIAVNIDEDQLFAGEYPQRDKVLAYAERTGTLVIEICARVEMEIGQLSPEERTEFMADLGLEEPGLNLLARTAYDRLGLLSFFTVGEDEVRAWTIRRGTAARHAAGKIHSDIERGFIRAEVFHFDDLQRLGSTVKAKEQGLFRLEGKEYPVQDGDIINFRFNV